MHRHARRFTRRVEARHGRILGVRSHGATVIRRDAAHSVVGSRLDWHHLLDGVYSQVGATKIRDVRQFSLDVGCGDAPRGAVRVLDAIFSKVAVDCLRAHVQIHEVFTVDTASLTNLKVDRARNHVTGGQILDSRRILGHETLALAVDQHTTLPADALSDQDAQAFDASRMELEELHVLHRNAATKSSCRPIAGQRVRVRGDLPDAAETSRRDDRCLGVESMDGTTVNVYGDHSCHLPTVVHQQIYHLVFVKEGDVVLDALLIHGLQDHVARTICCMTRAAHRLLGDVVRMTTKRTLGNATIRSSIERQSHVFQIVDHRNRFVAHNLDRILIREIIRSFDGVEDVPLRVILFDVAQSRADAALSGAGVRASWVELADHSGLCIARGVEGSHQPGAACTHNDYVKAM